jgi:hypothetical protein
VPIQYLLPCTCGRKMPVELRQAGELASCPCGLPLEIPRLLELKKLEKVTTSVEKGKNKPIWGAGHGLVLLGVIVLLIVAVCGGLVVRSTPANPLDAVTPEQMRAQSAKLTPVQTWQTWLYFKQNGLNPRKEHVDRFFDTLYAQRQMILTFLSVAGVGGIGMLIAGIFVIRRKRPAVSVSR